MENNVGPRETEDILIEEENTDNISFWNQFKKLLENEEVKKVLGTVRKVWIFKTRTEHLIESIITIVVAGVLIALLGYFVSIGYIDKSTFGVMFGTIFGYLLSWRFNR